MAPSILQSMRGSKRNGTLEHVGATLDEQVEALREELASLAELIREKGQKQGKYVRKQAEAGIEDLLSSSEDVLQEMRDLYARGGDEVRKTVQRHPFATIGAAAAVGVLFALLARR